MSRCRISIYYTEQFNAECVDNELFGCASCLIIQNCTRQVSLAALILKRPNGVCNSPQQNKRIVENSPWGIHSFIAFNAQRSFVFPHSVRILTRAKHSSAETTLYVMRREHTTDYLTLEVLNESNESPWKIHYSSVFAVKKILSRKSVQAQVRREFRVDFCFSFGQWNWLAGMDTLPEVRVKLAHNLQPSIYRAMLESCLFPRFFNFISPIIQFSGKIKIRFDGSADEIWEA